MQTRQIAAVAVVAALAIACGREPTGPPQATQTPLHPQFEPTAVQSSLQEGRTPLQQSIMQSIAERRAQGLPVPEAVTYTFEEKVAEQPPAAPGLMLLQAPAAPTRTYEARTSIEFLGPEQAGLTQWPAAEIRGSVPAGSTGFVKEGDYTAAIRQRVAEQYPGSNVQIETGPRTYTYTETIVAGAAGASPGLLNLNGDPSGTSTTSNDVLLGFTLPGPNLDYHVEASLEICVFWWFGCVAEIDAFNFWSGFQLDWTIGARLPLAVSLTSPDPVTEGSDFSPTTAATGVDWSAEDYTQAGVLPEGGHEFILRFIFKVGVFLDILEVPVVDMGVDLEVDTAESFATPLGAGVLLPLPAIPISVWNLDVSALEADVGVTLTPNVGSDRFTAGWLASGQGSGSGSLTYTTSGQGVGLGTFHADDGPGTATVDLSGFRYYFNQFRLDLGVYFHLMAFGYGGTWPIPITGFDLSVLTGALYIGPHAGTPGTVSLSVPVVNVAPTAAISRAGAVMASGRQVFLARSGRPLSFSGTATDPGEDDLTLVWDFQDGAPAPDHSTTYPVPHNVTETQTNQFSGACTYQVLFRAVDDDDAAGEDRVPVVVAGASGNRGRMEGYWQHQLGRNGNTDFDDATLECYLAIATSMSSVFGEVRNLESVAQGYDVLFMQHNKGDPLEQFDRELLVLWLNFAHGAIDYDASVDTNDDNVADTPFADVMAAAESARRNPAATAQQIRVFTRILHHISEMVS